MRYITLDEAVATATSVISEAQGDADSQFLFRSWGWDALCDLGISDDEIKIISIKPKNLIAIKPPDMRIIIDIVLKDSSGNRIDHVFRTGKRRIYPETSLQTITTESGDTTYLIDVSEDRKAIYLGTNATDVATVEVRYFSYPIDDKGEPMIRQEEKMAIVYFIRMMWAMKKNDNRSEIAQNNLMWKEESDRARARKKNINNEIAKTILTRWRSLIARPYLETF